MLVSLLLLISWLQLLACQQLSTPASLETALTKFRRHDADSFTSPHFETSTAGSMGSRGRALGTSDPASACCRALETLGFASNLPIAIINSGGVQIPDEPKINATLCTCSTTGHDWEGPIAVEIRGSSSARDFEKKSFAIKLHDTSGLKVKFPLLGFAADSGFALHGPEADRTIGMRNVLAMAMSNEAGLWAPNCTYLEVFLVQDGAELDMRHYHGLYILMETVTRGKHRVDIQARSGIDFSGGYIWKQDNDNFGWDDAVVRLDTSQIYMTMVYPKKEGVTRDEAAYMKRFLDGFESTLMSPAFADPHRGYRSLLNISSFIDYFLVVEITKNPDGYRGSTYMHKDRNGPMQAGPVWDFDEAFGSCCGYPIDGYMDAGRSGPGISGGSAISPNGWRFNICADPERCLVDPQDGISQWYRRFWQDPAFRADSAQRWRELRLRALADLSVLGVVNTTEALIAEAASRNYQRWKPVAKLLRNAEWAPSVAALKSWTAERLAWMDSQFAAL